MSQHGIELIRFGDVVEFASLERLANGSSSSLTARFVITEIISDAHLLSAAKIMAVEGEERLSRAGTMEPPVRKINVDPWDIGRVATAMLWQFGPDMDLERLKGMFTLAAAVSPAEYPTL